MGNNLVVVEQETLKDLISDAVFAAMQDYKRREKATESIADASELPDAMTAEETVFSFHCHPSKKLCHSWLRWVIGRLCAVCIFLPIDTKFPMLNSAPVVWCSPGRSCVNGRRSR